MESTSEKFRALSMKHNTTTHVEKSKVPKNTTRFRVDYHAEARKTHHAANPNPSHSKGKRKQGQSEEEKDQQQAAKRTPRRKHNLASSSPNPSEEEGKGSELYSDEPCAPSYRYLREREPPRGGEILNSQCRLVAPPYDSKHGKKTESQLAQLLLEDDRFELDIYRHRIESAIKYAEKLMVMEKAKENRGNHVESWASKGFSEYAKAQDRKCIELLFDDDGKTILKQLESHPSYVAPIVIARLKSRINFCKQIDFPRTSGGN